jgi:hypothetical protein
MPRRHEPVWRGFHQGRRQSLHTRARQKYNSGMKVIDLGDEHRALFACCLEDWSAEALAAGPPPTYEKLPAPIQKRVRRLGA